MSRFLYWFAIDRIEPPLDHALLFWLNVRLYHFQNKTSIPKWILLCALCAVYIVSALIGYANWLFALAMIPAALFFGNLCRDARTEQQEADNKNSLKFNILSHNRAGFTLRMAFGAVLLMRALPYACARPRGWVWPTSSRCIHGRWSRPNGAFWYFLPASRVGARDSCREKARHSRRRECSSKRSPFACSRAALHVTRRPATFS
jgi:hypothetical protein